MIIQVDCVGNLGLVHALFCELGRADAVNTSTKDQQLVAHLDTPDWPMIDDNNISRAHCLTEESSQFEPTFNLPSTKSRTPSVTPEHNSTIHR